GQTTSSITGLCAGPYTLTVKDGNNCAKVLTFSVTQTNSISATFTTTQPSGCGANNGSICITPSGGNGGPYTYTWSPVAGNASCLTGLGAGVYSVIIGNAGCTASLSALLTNPTGPTLNIATTSVNCAGGATGSATVSAIGTAPFGFTWTAGVGFVTTGSVSIGSSLNSGNYAITVSQSNSCITTQTINIATAPAFTLSPSVTNPKCIASCNGSITLVTSGGTPGYTVAWSPGIISGQGTQTVTNLCAGPYTVNITDANSCVKTQTFNLVDPPAIVLTNTATNVKCFGACNGSIVANASGGTSPLSYTWLPVPPFNGSTTATVLNLCPNVYTVVVTDGNQCTKTNTINITQPTQLTSTLTSINATCSNSCNATATLVGAGGTPGYNYSWTNSASTTSIAAGLCAGSYSGTITDANNCPVIQTFTITAPPAFAATLATSNPLCNAACNGSIATTLSGAQGTVSFVWLPSGSGQNPTNLCPNNYTLTATDNAGCQLSSVATLTNPPAVLANVSFTNPACNASCNGVAISSPANTTGTVSYIWMPTGATTQSVNSLCAGNYTVQIQDQNGCQGMQTFTLTNPPLLNVNPSSAPATCSFSNGSISLLVSGGTPTYNFSWNPSVSTTSVANGLGAGIYTVIVTDANNCTNTVSIPLSNSNGPSSAQVTSSSITCNGMCTGAASVNPATITGGTPGYTITWVSPASPNPLTGLCAGTYSAQITDALSCILFTAVTISEPPPITINPNVGLPTCNGICDGSVTLNTSGGTPSYTYNWTPAAPNSSVITNVCAGTLTVQIIDSNLCPSTQTVNVQSIQNIAVTTATTNNLCFGSCAGSASVTTISNGIAPFTENWSNGQFGSTASALCNGIYTVMVTASNGCTNNFTTSITSPAQISATNAITSPSCNLCNGVSIATATGGVGPYTYSWTSGATTSTATNLCAGLYQVLVTDNFGCNQIINVPISNVPGITGENFTIVNEQCAGSCNGAATVQAVGGIAPITYTWLTTPAVTNSVAVSLCSGSYFVQMQDAQGCIRTSSTTIGSAPGLTLSPFISPPTCGATDGTISIVPSGGTGPYTYTWIPSGNSSSLTNIGPGNYTVSVTDVNGCSKTSAFTLSNFNNPSITYTQTNVNCFGACTGSIVALGTSTAGPVTYSWSAGGGLSTITNVCPGVITLTVTSTADNCIALQSFTVTDNPAMQLSISNVQNVKCFGDCDGQVTLIPSGGILPYTFTWTPGSASNPQFSLCAGTYSGTVIDSKGCSITTTATINGPLQPLAITNTVVNSSCSTSADGSASVTLNGGTPSYTYNWTSAPSFTSNSQNLTNVFAGTYTLNAIDANSCTISTTIQIVPTITVDAHAGRDSVFCSGGAILLDGSSSVGGSGGYVWTNITLTNTVTVANTSTVNVMPSVGSNTYILTVISSVSTCIDMDTVVVNSLPLPVVDAGPSYTIPLFSNITIGGNPTAATAISYTWSPSLTLDNPTIPNPTASNTVNTTYTITVTDANGCTASDTMQVLLYPEIKIPNGFSPNGDSRNDKWIIDNINQFPDNVVEVYNRWGELLFRSEGYNVPFDGKYNNKDLPVGTYYYIINLNHPAYPKPYTGPLTIFR
ncbi:MAG: T9SS type B sorting domain-containing protein, partial [Bacteroidia bacterium]